MTNAPFAPRFSKLSANARGAFLMSLAMLAFALEDLFVKSAARTLPTGQIMVWMGICGICVFGAMARAAKEPIWTRAYLAPTLLIRSGFEIAGRLFFILALAFAPMVLTVAILQASPLVVMAGAALVFGEKIGWRRWLAIGAGFCGVMLILRPSLAGISWLSMFALLGMLGFSGRDLATRAAPKVLSNRQLGVLGFAMLGLAGGILLLVGKAQGEAVLVWPASLAWFELCLISSFAISGYHALTAAMRLGDVGAIAPFRYTRLIFAMTLALVFLAERPDWQTLLGSVIIIGSGIYTLRASPK